MRCTSSGVTLPISCVRRSSRIAPARSPWTSRRRGTAAHARLSWPSLPSYVLGRRRRSRDPGPPEQRAFAPASSAAVDGYVQCPESGHQAAGRPARAGLINQGRMAATELLTPNRKISATRPAPMEPRIFRRIAQDVQRERRVRQRATLPRGAPASAGLTPQRSSPTRSPCCSNTSGGMARCSRSACCTSRSCGRSAPR